ncbi:MAG: radical SAM family heme chaperone HemW [archaeon]|jgi:oxygen-independent coproporphyrinogen-3 oxidase|nr:radical SAM family heme chaperone HemW [archaeon]
MTLKELQNLDLKKLALEGIEKSKFDSAFVYRYPFSEDLPPVDLKEFEKNAFEFDSVKMPLYIHIPFCTKACFYCHYFKTVPSSEKIVEDYLRALEKEAAAYSKKLENKAKINCLFFGGGTPTYLSAEKINKLVSLLKEKFEFAEKIEATIESSPETLSEEKIFALADKFNRLSIGVQSFDNKVLHDANRNHSSEEAVKAIEMAKAAGFKSVNIDLIYGLSGQSTESWQKTLETAAGLGLESVTASSLRILCGTKFRSMPKTSFPSEEQKLKMHSAFIEKFSNQGMLQCFPYQFVKQGQEMFFLENQWSNGEFLGLGASSCSFLNKWDFNNWYPVQNYVKKVEENGFPTAIGKRISKEEEMIRMLALGMKKSGVNRKDNGVNKADFEKKFGVKIEASFGTEILKLKKLDLLKESGSHLGLSSIGLLFFDEVARIFASKN